MSAAAQIALYGASNLWLSRGAALQQLRSRFDGFLEIGLANGPGRSYGLRAGNPLVRYEPLSAVRFFTESAQAPQRLAFITDIGNDIAYAQPPRRVLAWVADLAAELERDGYQLIVGGVPRESLESIDPRVFQAIAKVYYPQGTISKDHLTAQLEELETGLAQLCRERGYQHPSLDNRWYSMDRFHLKLSSTHDYWRSLLSSFPRALEPSHLPLWSSVRPLFPERYWLLGRERAGRSLYQDLAPQSRVWVK